MGSRSRRGTRARCGGCTSRPAPSATSPRPRPRIPRCSRAGTGPRSRAACFPPPRRSRPASSPAHTPMPISTSPSHNWTRHWARRGLVSLLAAAGSACARPQPVTPGTEPALRIGLAGVSGGEMAPRRRDERQAVLAQAVVSRTFALKNRGRWEGQGFDAWADVRDQVYTGVAGETGEVWDALRATRGEVVWYGDALIEAYFHSTCGSRTTGAEEAFRTARGRPYLRSVSDESGGGHAYCDISPRFRWREEWDAATLRAILSRTLPAVMNVGGGGLQRITDVAVTGTTPSGRVGELRIAFEHGDVRVPGSDVRAVLRPRPDQLLGSAAFQLSVTKDGGQVTRVIAAGAGWGHGVGLCQWGAVGRARAGQDYRTILTTYFPGTHVERLY